MSDDIVARLRKLDRDLLEDEHNITDFSCVDVAADEIERLRTVVQGWENSARNAERDITELRAERDDLRQRVTMLAEAAAEDARRMAALERMIAKKEPIL